MSQLSEPANIYLEESVLLRVPCDAPAPLVLNGGPFAGCQKERDHEGLHELMIRWERR